MTLCESSFTYSNHKALRLTHDKRINKDQICSSCIQPCFFAHECNPHDINVINVTQHTTHARHKIASTTFLHCIQKVRNRTNFLHCIQKVHEPHTISLQASNTVSIYTRVSSFNLRGRMLRDVRNTGDLSSIM